MQILYIITQAGGGGAQKYVLALAKHFQGAIAAGQESQKLLDEAKIANLDVYPLKHLKRNINPWHDFWAIWEIRQLIKLIKPDIVHLNSSKAGILGTFAAIGLKTKVIFTAHGFIFNEPLSLILKNFCVAGEKIASDFRDYIICVSEADKNSALKYNLIAPNKISVIHNGIGKIDFLPKEDARKALGLPANKKILVTIANDYKTKGLDVLEKAIALKPMLGILIAVIGGTSNKKKSTDQIMYLGYKENAAQYLKAFNGTVIPSRKEGFPFTILEALQAGQAIIASRVGGLPEALGDAGELVPSEDPKALSETIERIFKDEKKAAALSQKALERSKLFTEEKMLGETKKIYQMLVSN